MLTALSAVGALSDAWRVRTQTWPLAHPEVPEPDTFSTVVHWFADTCC